MEPCGVWPLPDAGAPSCGSPRSNPGQTHCAGGGKRTVGFRAFPSASGHTLLGQLVDPTGGSTWRLGVPWRLALCLGDLG